MKASKLKEGQARVVLLCCICGVLLHLRGHQESSPGRAWWCGWRGVWLKGRGRCLSGCLFAYIVFFRTQISGQLFLLIANKLNELRPFCFPANPFMLWCLLNDMGHSQKWQPSLLKVLRPHPALSQEKGKGCCSPKYQSHILWPLAGEGGLCDVWRL